MLYIFLGMSQHPPTYRKWNWLLTWCTSIQILLQDASRWAACSSASRFVRYCVRTKKYLPQTTKNIWNFTRNTQLLCVLLCCASETKAVIYGNPLLFAARKDWHDSEKIWKICSTKALLAVLCPLQSHNQCEWIAVPGSGNCLSCQILQSTKMFTRNLLATRASELNNLLLDLEGECTLETCPMSSKDEWIYHCNAHRKARESCAIECITHTMLPPQPCLLIDLHSDPKLPPLQSSFNVKTLVMHFGTCALKSRWHLWSIWEQDGMPASIISSDAWANAPCPSRFDWTQSLNQMRTKNTARVESDRKPYFCMLLP